MDEQQKGRAETFFAEFGRQMDAFLGEVKEAGSRVEGELKTRFDELKAAAERVKKETENKERWKEVEAGLKRAGEELEKAVKAAFKK
ncbi:MAG: hypothetical protein MUC38_02080 [Cyclobacteriaceae bacterium]|jgi:hypothetical protein|nr:hypothetical protein [Cyclobacteriaceae bacterium]